MHIRYLIAALAAAGITLAVAQPAIAGDTSTTFTVSAGSLSIAVPASASLGAAAPGATVAAQLGAVTVTDARAALVATWTATASSAPFTTGTATPAETVATSQISYWSGASTATTGTGIALPGQANSAAAVVLTTPRTAFSMTVGVGNNSVTWNPTLQINLPAAAVTGLYTGLVTHSAA